MSFHLRGRAWAADGVCVAIVVGLVLGFGADLLAGKVPFFRDLGPYFYPMRYALAESCRRAEFPLWDRHLAMGFPLLADFQSGGLYPPHLVYCFLPFFPAVNAVFIFHYALAAVGAYVLGRQWNFRHGVAMTAAVLYSVGGLLVSLSNVLNHFQTAAWLPWSVWAWERALARNTFPRLVSLAFVLVLQLLAGSPEIYAMTLVLLVADGFRLRSDGVCSLGRIAGLVTTVHLLVAGLAMAQILPTLELLSLSRRTAQLPYQEAVAWSLHPLSLVNLFFPDKEIDPETGVGIPFFLDQVTYVVSHYLGAVAALGLLFWACHSSIREKASVGAAIVFFLVLAFGDRTPLYAYLYNHVPFFAAIRFPEKFFFLAAALLLFAAVRGLHAFYEKDESLWKIVVTVGWLPAVAVGVYGAFRLRPGFLFDLIAMSPVAATPGQIVKIVPALLVFLERQILVFTALAAIAFLYRRRWVSSPICQGLLVVLAFVDLATVHRPYHFAVTPPALERLPLPLPPPAEFDRTRIFYLLRPGRLHPDTYAFSPRPFAEVVPLLFSALVPNTGAVYGFDYMQEIDALARKEYDSFLRFARTLEPERLYRLLGALNVEYVLTYEPARAEKNLELMKSLPDYPLHVYRIRPHASRASLSSRAIVEKDPVRVFQILANDSRDGLLAILEEPVLESGSVAGFEGEAKIIRYEHREMVLTASLSQPGILVLADTYYPGWRAWVDGVEQPILRANVFFRALVLSPGEHLVEFRYEPASFRLGLSISVATLVSLFVFAAFRMVRGRRWQTARRCGPVG